MQFKDRREAGRRLAEGLSRYRNQQGLLVLGLPRGGIPVAYEVARSLRAPLDVFLVRKLGVPGREELAMGAIAAGGARIINEEVVRGLGIQEATIEAVAAQEWPELERREQLYRGNRPPPQVQGQRVILIDDGIATGSTMRAAIAVLQQQAPQKLICAVPVAAPQSCREFGREVDEMVCLYTPEPFRAVGLWYHNFSQTTDEEVSHLLRTAAQADLEWQEGDGEDINGR